VQHQISYYTDGYRARVAFCCVCSKEGLDLLEPCEPYATKCHICGDDVLSDQSCKNCEIIKKVRHSS
jgi:hypothetical protein